MPVQYDDREFSQLYLPAEENPIQGEFVTKESPAGQKILRRFFDQEEAERLRADKEKLQQMKLANDIEKQRQLAKKLSQTSGDQQEWFVVKKMQPMENNFLPTANGLLPSHWQKLWLGAFLDKSRVNGCIVGRIANNVTLRKVEHVTFWQR